MQNVRNLRAVKAPPEDVTRPEEAPAPKSERSEYPSPNAPLDVAREIYTEYNTERGRTLLSWRGGWWQWRGTHWSELEVRGLQATLYKKLGDADYIAVGQSGKEELRPWNPDKRKIANLLDALAAIAHLPTTIDPPARIGTFDAAKTPAAQMISCTNGILDLTTRTLSESTPALFNLVSVPFDYRADAGPPTAWLEFLNSVWPGDAESVALLQEYVGYILSGRTDMQKMLLLVGPTRSGKGTIGRLVTELVGRRHAAGPTLASLGTNFGLSALLGKPLAIIADARLGSSTPTHTVVERLLSITGEDMLDVDRKFKDPWSGKLSTRIVVLTNELPKFRDSSAAIANRMLILQMMESFLGKEDRTLDDRLRAELPGILLWALEGLDRLIASGRFTVPASSGDAAALMADIASPVSAFVRERCHLAPDEWVPTEALYAAWRRWAEDNGHHSGTKSSFGQALLSAHPRLKRAQRTAGTARIPIYRGVTLCDRIRVGIACYICAAQLPAQDAQDEMGSKCTGCGRAVADANALVAGYCTGCTGKNALLTLTAPPAQATDGDPTCIECGRGVVARQADAAGNYVHLECAKKRGPEPGGGML